MLSALFYFCTNWMQHLHIVQWTLYIVRRTLCTVWCTYTVQCIKGFEWWWKGKLKTPRKLPSEERNFFTNVRMWGENVFPVYEVPYRSNWNMYKYIGAHVLLRGCVSKLQKLLFSQAWLGADRVNCWQFTYSTPHHASAKTKLQAFTASSHRNRKAPPTKP